MERSTILRWVIIGVAVWLFWQYGLPMITGKKPDGKGTEAYQPAIVESTCNPLLPCEPATREPETTCNLKGVRFDAQITSKGANVKHLWLNKDARYQINGSPIDLATSWEHEYRRSLRFDWRTGGVGRQVAYDVFDWKIESSNDSSCTLSYVDDSVALKRVFRVTEHPFEIAVESTIKNLSADKQKHRLSVEATSWRYQHELVQRSKIPVLSLLSRPTPWVTDVAYETGGKITRMTPSDFDPDDFSGAGYEGGWFVSAHRPDFVAVSDFYFSQAIVPIDPPASASMLRIEDRFHQELGKEQDPNSGAYYRARVAYDGKELQPNEEVKYQLLAYLGPKERDVLATAGPGDHHLGSLVDLGYFSFIAKYLLLFLVWLHAKLGNWGIAIILMTVSVRTLLFPLTWKSIQSGLSMRRLKPELDSINARFKDDPQQKNLATMELWKKNKVNPFGGCLPAIFQLPVWWALYTALQTAVELYNTPFLWFQDLSAPDPYFVLPVVLGVTMVIQQKIMPQQLDAAQQKMMTYVMPLVFTVMMWFMPAGLAVYMLTNAVLGIGQQLAIEKYWSGGINPNATAKSVGT